MPVPRIVLPPAPAVEVPGGPKAEQVVPLIQALCYALACLELMMSEFAGNGYTPGLAPSIEARAQRIVELLEAAGVGESSLDLDTFSPSEAEIMQLLAATKEAPKKIIH